MISDNSCILTAEIDFVRVEQGDEKQRIDRGTRINLNNHWGVLVYKRGKKPVQVGGKSHGQGKEEKDRDGGGASEHDYLENR